MNWKCVLPVAAVLALAGCGGGGGDSGTIPGNHAPEVAFTFKPLATEHGVPVDLSVTATDQDGDPLTISWKITRGTLTAQNSKKTIMRWATPAGLGVDTVNVSVSDGSVTRKLTQQIRVATVYSGGLSFTKANSPYILTRSAVDPRLQIADGSTLTIEPGTEIYVNTPGTVFDVQGTLDAHGTTDEHIVIRYNDRSFICGAVNAGTWAGIRGSGTGVIDLEYVELWYAQYGVRLKEDSVGDLQHVLARCSASAGLSIEGSGYVRALDSQFTDGANDGIDVVAPLSLPDSVRVERCNVSFNVGSGIRMDLNDVAKATPVIVSYNDIEYNQTHGVSLAHAVFPQMHLNTFTGNGTDAISNLFLEAGYPSVAFPELDATCNFWGVASHQSTVDAGIWDSLDQSTIHTRVKSCPWLKSNPLTSTPDCSMSCPAP